MAGAQHDRAATGGFDHRLRGRGDRCRIAGVVRLRQAARQIQTCLLRVIERTVEPQCLRIGEAKRAIEMTERSEEHTSELQSLLRISYAVFCLKKKTSKEDKEQYTQQI